MKKIYVLRHWYDNEDNSGGEVIAASENLHTLNSIMRDSVKRSGVLEDEETEWDEDETEFLTDDPNQMYVCYSFLLQSLQLRQNRMGNHRSRSEIRRKRHEKDFQMHRMRQAIHS